MPLLRTLISSVQSWCFHGSRVGYAPSKAISTRASASTSASASKLLRISREKLHRCFSRRRIFPRFTDSNNRAAREIAWQKVALVTGANKGIGFEVSRALGKAGFTVLLGARDGSRGEEAASKLRAEALDVRFVHADLEHAHETATALAEKISRDFGRSGCAGKQRRRCRHDRGRCAC